MSVTTPDPAPDPVSGSGATKFGYKHKSTYNPLQLWIDHDQRSWSENKKWTSRRESTSPSLVDGISANCRVAISSTIRTLVLTSETGGDALLSVWCLPMTLLTFLIQSFVRAWSRNPSPTLYRFDREWSPWMWRRQLERNSGRYKTDSGGGSWTGEQVLLVCLTAPWVRSRCYLSVQWHPDFVLGATCLFNGTLSPFCTF